MRVLSVFLFVIVSTLLVAGQTDLVSDPGLETLEGNQCTQPWHFRSDFLWNRTDEFFDSQCQASVELPTQAVPGLTAGRQTNVNKALIPPLPEVAGGLRFNQSAGVVDMNTPCRAALWYPFTLENNTALVTVSLKLWVRSNGGIQQVLSSGSAVTTAPLLQYLASPEGLLITTTTFPPLKEETNSIRIDILLPDETGGFYSRAFSLIPEQIAVNIPIPGFASGTVTPPAGTNGQWIDVTADISDAVPAAGTYALRVASAQSRVGVSWGISDVHVVTEGGVPPDNVVVEPIIYDVIVENSRKTIGGVATFSKISNIELPF
jgi:hypothetical protein